MSRVYKCMSCGWVFEAREVGFTDHCVSCSSQKLQEMPHDTPITKDKPDTLADEAWHGGKFPIIMSQMARIVGVPVTWCIFDELETNLSSGPRFTRRMGLPPSIWRKLGGVEGQVCSDDEFWRHVDSLGDAWEK